MVKRYKCYDGIAIYIVKIPAKDQNTPEVMDAAEKDLQNIFKYEGFGKVNDIRWEKIGSRWVIAQKEKADGQKNAVKWRLVARGFQEK